VKARTKVFVEKLEDQKDAMIVFLKLPATVKKTMFAGKSLLDKARFLAFELKQFRVANKNFEDVVKNDKKLMKKMQYFSEPKNKRSAEDVMNEPIQPPRKKPKPQNFEGDHDAFFKDAEKLLDELSFTPKENFKVTEQNRWTKRNALVSKVNDRNIFNQNFDKESGKHVSTTITLKQSLRLKKDQKLFFKTIDENNRQYFIGLKCVTCEIYREFTDLCFNANNGGKNHETALPGHETFKNFKSNPCRRCTQPQDKRQFKNGIHNRYPKYTPADQDKTFADQNGLCALSKLPISWAKGKISVNAITNHGGKNSEESHVYSNISLILPALNIRQDGETIGDLKDMWIFYANLKFDEHMDHSKKFVMQQHWEPKQSGVIAVAAENKKLYNDQRMEKCLNAIVMQMILRNTRHDVDAGRIRAKSITTKNAIHDLLYPLIIELFVKQRGMCAISGIPFTIRNGRQRFSIDRLNDDEPHYTATIETDADGNDMPVVVGIDNCQLVLRTCNGPTKVSPELFQHMKKLYKV
jgi:hypothetical protein